MESIIVYCADIGSIKNSRFGWCRGKHICEITANESGNDINEFVEKIKGDLLRGKKVALGFECPLFVPITNNPVNLTSARNGEGNRPWSAGAGSGALAVGLVEAAWIFQKIKEFNSVVIKPTFSWNAFVNKDYNLFIWEAFISGKIKADTHAGDAEIAVEAFKRAYPNIEQANSVTADNPYSLVAAAILRSGLSNDITLLQEPCIVIKGLLKN